MGKIYSIIDKVLERDNCNLSVDRNVIMFSHFNSDLTKILFTITIFPNSDSEKESLSKLNEIEEYLNNSENFK